MSCKSQRKQLQRQLEFYLSASNLRQDKFLQQHMDEAGMLPVDLFLSFNRLKSMKVTERLILEAANKSSLIKVDAEHKCIAPVDMSFMDTSMNNDDRTIYVEGFSPGHDHDSLRRLFARVGKVNLVSMPRFQHSRKLKGFAFIEFATPDAAGRARVEAMSLPDFDGFQIMLKTKWLELKEKLKAQLNAVTDKSTTITKQVVHASHETNSRTTTTTVKKKRPNQHILFEAPDNESDSTPNTTKRPRIEETSIL